jgi:predicted Rdx family selenoprotein
MCLPLLVSEETWERWWGRKVWQWSTYCSIDISGLSVLCLVHRNGEFPFFLEWHRVQLLNVLWLLKGSWMFQVNNLREEIKYLASRPVTVVASATKSGQCLFMVSVNDMHCRHCIWLLRMIKIEQLSQTQVNVTQLLYVGPKQARSRWELRSEFFLYTHAAWLFQMHLLGLMLLYPLNILDPITATPL